MNLFKLINISAAIILVCLGIAVKSTTNELGAPFLSIPRVTFDTVPVDKSEADDEQKNPDRLFDETKTGIFATKFIDGLLPLLSAEKQKFDQTISTILNFPLGRITLVLDSSTASISISVDPPDEEELVNKEQEEKSDPAIAADIENSPLDVQDSDLVASTAESGSIPETAGEFLDVQTSEELPVEMSTAEQNSVEEPEIAAVQGNDDTLQAEEALSESSEDNVQVQNEGSNSLTEVESLASDNESSATMVYQLPLGENPLTGLAPTAAENLDRRPMMIKVSNFPRNGRPQAGLTFADMVFEYYIGEEMNRFLAVFYGSDSPQVGPIRSGALVDSQLANFYQGILNYGNEDPQVDGILSKAIEDRALPVWRCSSPAIEGVNSNDINGVFGNTAELSNLAHKLNISNSQPSLEGMVFSSDVPEDSIEANMVAVEYTQRNRGEWHYDPETGLYDRWSEYFKDGDYFMEPLYDRVNGQPLRFANVIILFADYDEVNPTRFKIDLIGNREGEKAFIFRDGIMVEGIWKVISPSEPIRFFAQDGEAIALKPGNTWIAIADFDSDFEEVDHGEWELKFAIQ